MCGIVGFVGRDEAAPILLDGLSRPEYRGYDSAGIMEQPEAIRKTRSPRIRDGRVVLNDLSLTAQDVRDMDKLCVIACGSFSPLWRWRP